MIEKNMHWPEYSVAYPEAVFFDYSLAFFWRIVGVAKLTTLTQEFFVPGFLERDEGERERPHAAYPWDGVSGVRPYHVFSKTTTVGVY